MEKKLLYVIIAILIAMGGFFVLGPKAAEAPEEAPAAAAPIEAGAYVVIPEESELRWEGRKVLIPGYKDTGTLGIKDGSFAVAEDSAQGEVTFDMAALKAGMTGKGAGMEMLEKHLKSADFFNVAKFPEASFALTAVEAGEGDGQYTVSGDLTIKGIAKPVSFPALARMEGGKLFIEATTELDRTLWDIRYGSGKFFQNLANNVIDDLFGVSFRLVAAPAAE